ncbi:MAG: cytochrome c biogenesis CcdA family protein [Streptosporangiaceae bacterium]
MSVGSLMASGPLLLAIPVAAAAGAVTFLSPCVLPLVPGYLSYITGMSGVDVADDADMAAGDARRPGGDGDPDSGGPASGGPESDSQEAGGLAAGRMSGAARTATAVALAAAPARSRRGPGLGGPSRRRAVTGALLFVLGFSAVFALEGLAVGGISSVLLKSSNQEIITRILGALVILLGLLFAGVFERFSFAGRIVRPSVRPRAGLASAPLLGVLFGVGWTPCIGPTLGTVLILAGTTSTAARGGFLAFVYGLGIGIPFLIVAFAVERGVTLFGFARRHARLITRIGGLLLVVVGMLEVTGAWSSAMLWLKIHWLQNYVPPL